MSELFVRSHVKKSFDITPDKICMSGELKVLTFKTLVQWILRRKSYVLKHGKIVKFDVIDAKIE